MEDLIIGEGTDNMGQRIAFAQDGGDFVFDRGFFVAGKTSDIDILNFSVDGLLGGFQFGEPIDAFIGDENTAAIEGAFLRLEAGDFRIAASDGIENGGFAREPEPDQSYYHRLTL